MAIQLGIYNRGPDKGFGVFIKAVSGLSLDHFRDQLGEVEESSLSRGGTCVATTSERLKASSTMDAAKNWIIRFKHLSEEDQLSRVGTKWIKTRISNVVLARVKYYAFMVNGKLIHSTFDQKSLRDLESIYPDYTIRPTVSRYFKFEKNYLDQLLAEGRVEVEVANLKGAYAGFTAPTISKIRKRKLKNADRHNGYRIVGSVGFWNKK